MAGMWQLPTVERPPQRAPGGAGLFPASFPIGAELDEGEELGEVRHGITHHRIRARVRAGELRGRVAPPLRWTRTGDLDQLPLTGMTRKILRARFLAGARR
jgi:adenine-specific DNA glycosylase